jgi:stress response protein SCP2
MKITIFKVCLICLLAAFSIKTYAGPGAGDYNKIVSDFIASHMNSDYKKLNKIMKDDATFKLSRGESVVVQTKSDLVDDMKIAGTNTQNCDAKFEVVAKSNAIVIVRVDFNYENCTQQNFLTLEKNADREWKITQVCKIFNDREADLSTPKVIANN